jgi:hypothetical protein
MKSLVGRVCLAILLLLAATQAAAQERQVPFDQEGRLLVVDASMARQLGLWVEAYPGFVEARLFEEARGGYVLEITTQRGGERQRERVLLSPAEAAELRASIAERAAVSRLLVPGEQEGRYLLLGQTTLAGLGFYGWAVPEIVNAEGAGGAGLYLLTTAASFFVPFALTHDRPVSFGMANLSRYGITRGAAHGTLLYNTVERERRCTPESCPERSDRGRLATALLFSVGEGVGGYVWARNEEMTAGTANAIATFGDAGLLGGLGIARVAGLRGGGWAGSGVAGAAVGIAGGRALAARREYTWGDADLIYTGGIVGAFTGLAAAAVTDVSNDRAAIALTLAGGAAGLYLGDRLVNDTDFTVGQAVLNRLGALAGGLAGASVGVLMEEEKVAITGAALGAIGGYMLTYSALAPDARAGRGERFSRWDLQLNPYGMVELAREATTTSAASPLLNVTYRFGAPSGAR